MLKKICACNRTCLAQKSELTRSYRQAYARAGLYEEGLIHGVTQVSRKR